jgi:hypothetical protein
MNEKIIDKCIFDNTVYCKHFYGNHSINKYRCVIDRYTCDNLKYAIRFGACQVGLTDLIFTVTDLIFTENKNDKRGHTMTEKTVHNETDITITHDISVDSCIADEIKRLNNENRILTLSSCCGHGHVGYIVVSGNDIQKMLKLGYDMTTIEYFDNDIVTDDRIAMCAFKPKSKCNCNDE